MAKHRVNTVRRRMADKVREMGLKAGDVVLLRYKSEGIERGEIITAVGVEQVLCLPIAVRDDTGAWVDPPPELQEEHFLFLVLRNGEVVRAPDEDRLLLETMLSDKGISARMELVDVVQKVNP